MQFVETKIAGVWVIEPDRFADDRGHFARTFCREEFAARGLVTDVAQCSVSFNARAGTLRGMHWQAAPHGETKLVRCTRGAVYDVAVDLRAGSPTFKQWVAVDLSAENGRALYIPDGCAHGFQTRADASEVFYQISTPYVPEAGRGARWDDPAFAIDWPDVGARIISARDRAYPDFVS